jgi:anti-anti-sigma factor
MEVSITNGQHTTIAVKGRLDTVNAPEFEKAIAPIIAGNMKVTILDCTSLNYISSSGLRLFLTMQKTANSKKGKLVLKGMKNEIKEIFDMTGFSTIFQFE